MQLSCVWAYSDSWMGTSCDICPSFCNVVWHVPLVSGSYHFVVVWIHIISASLWYVPLRRRFGLSHFVVDLVHVTSLYNLNAFSSTFFYVHGVYIIIVRVSSTFGRPRGTYQTARCITFGFVPVWHVHFPLASWYIPFLWFRHERFGG